MKDLLDQHAVDFVGNEQTQYTRSYRERMRRKGFVKVEVWVPQRLRKELRLYAEKLRKQDAL